ncbi:MAG TPA: phosphopantetheine-binding protein, partial [Chitinophagaceae bacterium]
SWLGKKAVEEDKAFVKFKYLPTNRNLPALNFITGIGIDYGNSDRMTWIFPSGHLANIEYEPDEDGIAEHEVQATVSRKELASNPDLLFGGLHLPEQLQRIGENLYEVGRLSKAINEYRFDKQTTHHAVDRPPLDSLETQLVEIWRKVLGKSQIGTNDNFFEVGGTSLRAVQVVAMMKKELKQTVSIVTIFECPTVALLAAKLSAASQDEGNEIKAAAAQRGQQRRYNTAKRKVS